MRAMLEMRVGHVMDELGAMIQPCDLGITHLLGKDHGARPQATSILQ
jgi:hypothetical protein